MRFVIWFIAVDPFHKREILDMTMATYGYEAHRNQPWAPPGRSGIAGHSAGIIRSLALLPSSEN